MSQLPWSKRTVGLTFGAYSRVACMVCITCPSVLRNVDQPSVDIHDSTGFLASRRIGLLWLGKPSFFMPPSAEITDAHERRELSRPLDTGLPPNKSTRTRLPNL